MQVSLRRKPVYNQSSGPDEHSGQNGAEAHLGLAYAVVFPCEIGSQPVGAAGEGDGEAVADYVAEGYKARVGL